MNKFEKWLIAINEELTVEPTAEIAEPTAVSSREAIMSDVDNIMTSLETLAGELRESLNETEDLHEADNLGALGSMATGATVAGTAAAAGVGLAAKALIDWKIRVPKARAAQSKVNALNIKAAQLEDAMDAMSSGDKKTSFEKKISTIKDQASELQDQVDQKYSSSILQKAIQVEKNKAKIEIIKIKMGDATPEQQKELKDQLLKMNTSYKKNVEDLKSMEPEEKKADDAAPKKGEKQPEADKQDSSEEDGAKAAATKAAQQEEAKIEASISTYDENIQTEMDRVSKLNNDLSTAEREKEASTNPDEVEKKINSIKAEIGKSKEDINQMKAAKEKLKKQLSPKESLVIRATAVSLNELAAEISEKAEWQLEGTTLYAKYDSMIRKVEATNYLNESRSMTIKDKFSKLI